MSTEAADLAPGTAEASTGWRLDTANGSMVPRSALDVLVDLNDKVTTGNVGEYQPVPLGFTPMDKTIGTGLRAGELLLIGGAQGTGKTTMALQMARNIASGGQANVLLFFVLSKTLGFMLMPSNFLMGLGVIGAILLATRWRRLGRRLLAAAAILLAVCAFSPLGYALLYPLEQRFPPWDPARGAPDGIVILGASIEADLSAAHGVPVEME